MRTLRLDDLCGECWFQETRQPASFDEPLLQIILCDDDESYRKTQELRLVDMLRRAAHLFVRSFGCWLSFAGLACVCLVCASVFVAVSASVSECE